MALKKSNQTTNNCSLNSKGGASPLNLKGAKTMKIEIGQKTTNDLNQYCENENIKIIERLIKENKELRLKIQEVEMHHRRTLDYFNV